MELITGTIDQAKEKKKFKDMTNREFRLYIINKRESFEHDVTPEELVADTLPRLVREVDERAKERLLEFYEIVIDSYHAGYNWTIGDHSDLEILKEEYDEERKKVVEEGYKTRSPVEEMYEIMSLECMSSLKDLRSSISGRASRKARESGLQAKIDAELKKKHGDKVLTLADLDTLVDFED